MDNMGNRPYLSSVIITMNEEQNIARCLKSLQWSDELLVVDSGSTDKTVSIAKEFSATVLTHEWQGYGQQKNWSLQQVKNDWVLSVDADEELSPALIEEIQRFIAADGHVDGVVYDGARIPRKTWYLGRWILYGGWYPNYLVRLSRKSKSAWTEPTVHESLEVKGKIYTFHNDLFHYTFQNIGEQVQTNIRYSRLGAQVAAQRGEKGSILKILFKPIGKFLETYVWKLGFLDGFPGFVISINAAHSIFMKYVELRYANKNSHHR